MDVPDSKTCTKCGAAKPLTEYYKHDGCRDSRHSQCKACLREGMLARRNANLATERLRDRERYAADPEPKRSASQARYEQKRDEILAQRKADYEANSETIRAERRAERAADPQKYRDKQKAYLAANRERINKRRAEYRARNRDAVNARVKEQYSRYAETYKRSAARRRARLLDVYVADVDFDTILIRDRGVCGICRHPIMESTIELDHILPLAAGGTHEPDNAQIAHRACNRRKGAKVKFTLADAA